MAISSVVGAQSLIKPGVCTSSTRPASPFEGQMIYETDTDILAIYNGTAWKQLAAATKTGAILQIVSTTKTDTFSASVAAGSFAAITGLTATITPQSSSNKILVLASVTAGAGTAADGVSGKITGGNTASYVGASAGSRTPSASAGRAGGVPTTLNFNYLDSPATTSATTYGVSLTFLETGTTPLTVYCNQSPGDANASYAGRFASTITVMEISG